MDDKRLETNSQYLALALLASSALLAVLLLASEIHLQVGAITANPVYVKIMIFIIPTALALILGVILSGNDLSKLKVWVKDPTVTVNRNVPDIKQWIAHSTGRLKEVGFQFNKQPTDTLWAFSKDQASQVQDFEDHAFKGTITLQPHLHPVPIQLQLTMLDTLIVETGEFKKIETLANALIGNTVGNRTKTLPFTLLMTLAYCLIFQISGYFSYFDAGTLNLSFWSSGCIGFSLGLVTLGTIQNKPDLIGRRVAMFAVLSILPPLVSILINTLGL